MRIWFDLSNSPHVVFFSRLIRELSVEHEILITCRDLSNTIELLELEGFPHHVVGRHYGAKTASKLYGFAVRVAELRRFVKAHGVDVAVSHSSYYSPVVAASLRIPSLYLNDNEHAEGNRAAGLSASRLMFPEFVPADALGRQWIRGKRLVRYPGVKEGVYLWALAPEIARLRAARPEAGHRTIVVRPEPWAAHYYAGRTNFLDDTLLQLAATFRVVVLPRGGKQAAHYRQERFAALDVVDRSLSLTEVMTDCDLFLGAGGTMTREAAVLGIPTMSIYQEELLSVDCFLIEQGFMLHDAEPTADTIERFLDLAHAREGREELLDRGRRAYELIKGELLALPRTGAAAPVRAHKGAS